MEKRKESPVDDNRSGNFRFCVELINRMYAYFAFVFMVFILGYLALESLAVAISVAFAISFFAYAIMNLASSIEARIRFKRGLRRKE